MDARKLPTLKREHPSTILPESTGKPVAVTSTSESNDCSIRACKSKITPPLESSPKVDSSIRDGSKSRSVESLLEAKSRVHPSQRAVEGNDQQHGKHGVLRDLRDHSQSTVPHLCDILDERHCILYLRNMFATFRKFQNLTKIALMFCRFQTVR